MGVNDQPPPWNHQGVPQIVVAVVSDASPEMTEAMVVFLLANGIPGDRVVARWDTWKGLHFTPPNDEPLWAPDEYARVVAILERHPNILRTDTSPGDGSAG